MTFTVEEARDYAARGWRVFPLKPNTKTPAVNDWPNVATTDPDTITEWWCVQHLGGAGIGIATGAASGLYVLDVDTSGEKVGADSLADLEATYGKLPDTREVITGSGGRHLYFKYPEGVELRNTAGRLGRDLDTRGEGGYVVAPPSIHPDTGRAFEWELSSPDEPAEMPEWLLGLLTGIADEAGARRDVVPYAGSERPGDRFAAEHSWADLLEADGATYLGTRRDYRDGSSYEVWARPGVDHISATLYYGGTDNLKVFTPNWPGLDAEATYTRFGYHVATKHGGDFARATRELGDAERAAAPDWTADLPLQPAAASSTSPATETTEPEPDEWLSMLIDWRKFWEQDHAEQNWLAYPLIPAGRAVAFYAPAKAGKSTIILDVVAAGATGRPILGANDPYDPFDVLYLDYEMTEADLSERLTATGYGPDIDLSRLHYALLPTIPPLDTPAGAAAVVKLAKAVDAKLVVVDTFGRAVEGEENDNDTVRAFYRYTGLALKSAGIAVLRTDHSGKDATKGQRGASAKVDDVDVVWSLTATDEGVRIKRTHSRITWAPEAIDIVRTENSAGIVSYKMVQERGYARGTKEKVDELAEIGAPVMITVAEARRLLKAAGRVPGGSQVLSDAVRWRKLENRYMFDTVPYDKRPPAEPEPEPEQTTETPATDGPPIAVNVEAVGIDRHTGRSLI